MNTKALFAYIGLLVFILILAFVFLPTPKNTLLTTTVSGTTSVQQHTIYSTTASTSVFSNYSSCVSKTATTQIPNGNFSTGTYQNWTTSGVGFASAPTNLTNATQQMQYLSSPWSGYNGTFFASNYHGGTNIGAGNLTSDPILVTQPYLNFKLISPQNNQIYVEIFVNGKQEILTHFNTYAYAGPANGTSTFVNASINMIPVLCQDAQIRLVGGAIGISSNAQSKYYYIAATGFVLASKQLIAPGIIVNQSINS